MLLIKCLLSKVIVMLDSRYDIVQRGAQWRAVFGRDQFVPFGTSREAVDAAEAHAERAYERL
ncbi:hypothetical protein N8D56_25005 (plasmid) [Devosia sp. A8/3-2]|nr:hypothetical protein N8D56_25005 [Devosia sp. A8/3-2]